MPACLDHPWRALPAAPSLRRLGVVPLSGESRFVDGGAHMLDLPMETLTLVRSEEAEQDEPGKLRGFSWGAVGARVLQRLNQDLEAAGVADRLFSVYRGNDARALLLTPPMLAVILQTAGLRRYELPYTRTLAWPNFGMDTSTTLT